MATAKPPSSATPTTLDDITFSFAAAMAPMLLAVATFALTLLRQVQNPDKTHTDELFAFLSTLCLLGSATSADSALDACKATWQARVTFLHGGYLLYCVAIAALTSAVPILYAEVGCATPIALWRYLLFFITGALTGLKPMLYEESIVTTLMFAGYIFTLVVSAYSVGLISTCPAH